MKLEMIESVLFKGSDKPTTLKYQSVEGDSKRLVIDEFVDRFSGAHDSWGLKQFLESLTEETTVGQQTFRWILTDEEWEKEYV